MKFRLRQFEQRPRMAFTLTELLVAMAIFVVLATLAVGSFQADNLDRVGTSVGVLKNAVIGARSRAIHADKVRGIRLLTDSTDGRICRSVIYLGAPELQEGVGEITQINDIDDYVEFSLNDTAVQTLSMRGLLQVGKGLRVEFPANSGHWQVIQSIGSGNTVRLAGYYYTALSLPIENMTYRLELLPSVLPGAEPIALAPGTCIDLDGSNVPNAWRPPTNDPADRYSNAMDILFAPNGTVVGDTAVEGMLHFRIAHISDVILARSFGARPLQRATGTATPPNPVVPADPEKDHKALSILTSTGSVLSSEIDRSQDDGDKDYNENQATAPFRLAVIGAESK